MKAKSTTNNNNNRYNRINKAPHKCSFHYNLFCIVLYLCVCAWKKQRNASTLLAVLYTWCLYAGKIRENKTSQKVKPKWNCMWGCSSQASLALCIILSLASYARAHAQINAKLKHQTLTIHDISFESARYMCYVLVCLTVAKIKAFFGSNVQIFGFPQPQNNRKVSAAETS